MEVKSFLNETEIKYFEETSAIHNGVSIDDFYKNRKVDIGVRLMIFFLYLFSLDSNKNKDVNKRIFIHNRALLKKLGYEVYHLKTTDKEYLNFLAALQSTLRRYEEAGFFTREMELRNGTRIKASEAPGQTNRYIILNVNKCKQLLSSLPEDIEALGYKKRSRESRFILKRPITLKKLLLESIIKRQVTDVQAHKKVNKYLEQQYKKYADFSGTEVNTVTAFNAKGIMKDIIQTLLTAVYDKPDLVTAVIGQ